MKRKEMTRSSLGPSVSQFACNSARWGVTSDKSLPPQDLEKENKSCLPQKAFGRASHQPKQMSVLENGA